MSTWINKNEWLAGPRARCPCCGAENPTRRAGTELTKWTAQIFDAIWNATRAGYRRGIGTERLLVRFYPGVDRKKALQRIHTQIWKINDLLVGTDFRVVNVGNRHDARYVVKNIGDQGQGRELRARSEGPPAVIDR